MSDVSERVRLVQEHYEPASISIVKDNKDFDRMLRLVIPGDPVSDGRPRENKKLEIFYNQKKEFLRKIFRSIYKMDTLLQRLSILTPHRIEVRTYSLPTAVEAKYLSPEEISGEGVFSIGNKDNDNVEKVNWDVLQDTEFMIILNDSLTVNNETFKYYSYKPRTEICVYFSTTFTNLLYEQKIIKSMEYKFFMCSKKFTIDKEMMSDKDVIEYLGVKLIDIKTTAKKKVGYLLKAYPAEIIDGLFKYYFFNNAKNIFVDKYIKKKAKPYKITMITEAVTCSASKRKEILGNITKDTTYQTFKDDIEKDTLVA